MKTLRLLVTGVRSAPLAFVMCGAVVSGCAAASPNPADDGSGGDAELSIDASEAALHAVGGKRVLGLRFKNLTALGPNHVYEGWIIVNGEPVSAGRFSLRHPSAPLFFVAPRAAIDAATRYVLTIERKTGDDPGPSGVSILAGDIVRGLGRDFASLDVRSAFASDFSEASGSYILATPSTPAMDDYALGIWFVAAGAPSLTLPPLPSGWVYEGWVSTTSAGALSTGRFKMPAGADSDGAGPTAGPNGGPPFPGQDFITPPVDLVGRKIVVTVEPEEDDSPAPFSIKPLVDDEVVDLGEGVSQPLSNQAYATNPRGLLVVF